MAGHRKQPWIVSDEHTQVQTVRVCASMQASTFILFFTHTILSCISWLPSVAENASDQEKNMQMYRGCSREAIILKLLPGSPLLCKPFSSHYCRGGTSFERPHSYSSDGWRELLLARHLFGPVGNPRSYRCAAASDGGHAKIQEQIFPSQVGNNHSLCMPMSACRNIRVF